MTMAMAMAMAIAFVDDVEFLRGKIGEMKELGSIIGVEEGLQQLQYAVEAAGKEWAIDLEYKPLGQIGSINERADALLEKIFCWHERRRSSGTSSSSLLVNAITRFCNKIKFRPLFASELKTLISEYQALRSAPASSGERETHPKLEAPERIVGRDKDVEEIIWRIRRLQELGKKDGQKLHIIPIVGMPGVGKTTVAQMVYAHPLAVDIFQQRIWVQVSPYFDHKRVLRRAANFLRSIEPFHDDEDEDEDEDYIRILKEKLSWRTYLLVLDDFWNTNLMDWGALKHQLQRIKGAQGTVIVTTSRDDVAEMIMVAVYPDYFEYTNYIDSAYELQGLSEADCLNLFHELLQEQQLPLPQGEEDKERVHKIIHEKIIHGLPLEVLHLTKDFVVDKNYVPDLISRRIQNYYDSVSSMYEHLPIYLRHCFRFCSLFPQEHKYHMEELGEIWLALRYANYDQLKTRGLLHPESSHYDELWKECFFLLDSTQEDRVTCSKMHYSMHHFAKHLCRGTSQMMMMAGSGHNPPPRDCLHLSLLVDSETSTFPKDLYSLTNLKTLMLIREPQMLLSNHRCKISKIARQLLARIKYLCVLDLQYTMIKRLPRTVGKLLNLKYLNLSGTEITTLPRCIGKLQSLAVLKLVNCKYLTRLYDGVTRLVNLEKLDIAGCRSLLRVPDRIDNMKRLRCFNIKDCSSIIQMPYRLGQFTNLHTLPRYIVGDNDGYTIRELQDLRGLEGELRVENLQNVGVIDATTAKLKDKKKLKSLTLQWNRSMRLEWYQTRSEHAYEAQVLEELRPNKDLIKLDIISYMGTQFPTWLSRIISTYLSSLEEIKLFNLKRCQALPSLGFYPRLRVVEISGMDAITTVDNALYGTFPSLQRLTFSQMLNLKWWLDGDRIYSNSFPLLTSLTFIHCPQLVVLGMELPAVTELALWLNNERLYNSSGGLKGLTGSLKKLSICLCEQLSESSECKASKNSVPLKRWRFLGVRN